MAYPMAKKGSVDYLVGQLNIIDPERSNRANNICKRLAEDRTISEGYTRNKIQFISVEIEHYKNNLLLAIKLYSNGQEVTPL